MREVLEVRDVLDSRTARLCVLALLLLVALAIFCPALASDRPFVLIVPDGAAGTGFGALPAGVSYPWFSGLFDRNQFGSNIDLLFNGLMVIVPLLLLAWLVFRRSPRVRALLLVLTVPVAAGVAAGLEHRAPVRDYARRIQALRADGLQVIAVFPPIPLSPGATDVFAALEPPSARHLLGTDDSGRDVLVRLLYGARISFSIGVVAVSIYVVIGLVLGAVAGFFGGLVDALVLRLIEVVSCFPTFLLVMALIALVRERSLFHVMIVIGITGWPTIARLTRAELLKLSGMEFTQAARALGLPWWRVLFRHLLPNGLAPVMVAAAFGVAGAILIESGLAFLNLGDGSVASWGQILRVGRETGDLYLILAPGLLIFFTVTMMNLVAQHLRDALDPRL